MWIKGVLQSTKFHRRISSRFRDIAYGRWFFWGIPHFLDICKIDFSENLKNGRGQDPAIILKVWTIFIKPFLRKFDLWLWLEPEPVKKIFFEVQKKYIKSTKKYKKSKKKYKKVFKKSKKKIFFSRGPIEGTVEIHFLSGGGVSVVPLKAVDYL